MFLLINAGGRIVEAVDEEQYQFCLNQAGFRVPSAIEEADYLAGRAKMIEEIQRDPAVEKARHDKRIHFKTVRATPDGYGMSQGHLVREMREKGYLLEENYDNQRIGLLYNYPYPIVQMETDLRVVYTMFESDKIPDDWAEYLNQADLVLVPSRFCQATMKKAGIESTVVPLGYNHHVFKPLKRPIKMDEAQDFTFLHYNGFNLRKGFRELIEAFDQEFAQDEAVKLIIKTTMDHPPLPLPRSTYPNIEVITGQMSEEDLLKLHARSDAFVYPSRGEGFGITPLEAMATGMPAIVPNAHGIAEYFDPNCMVEVKVSGECAGLYNRFKGQDVGKMVICDVDDLRQKMRWLYTHQKEARAIGEKAAVYVQKYTYEKTAEKLAAIMDELTKRPITKRRDTSRLKVEEV